MMNPALLAAFPVAFPIFSGMALLLFPIRNQRLRHRYAASVPFINALLLLAAVFWAGEGTFTFWRVTESLALSFRLDALGKIFAVLVSVIWPPVTFYAFEYLKRRPPEERFFAFFLTTLGILIGIACAANFLTLYLFYELLTFATLPLVMHSLRREAIRAAAKYLVYSITGACLALTGFFFFYRYGISTDFTPGGVLDAARIAGKEKLMLTASFLTLVGFGAKAGLVPLHAWLPTAHPVAPTPASAVLSGLITKAGVVAIARTIYFLVGPRFLRGTWVQTTLIVLSLLTIFLGSMLAYMEKHLKKRIAYSSVSQVSYIVFGLMLLTPDGIKGALLQIVAHALAKTSLFLSAGMVIYFRLSRFNYHYVDQLRGVGKDLPVVMIGFTLASLSLVGIPPTGGFVGKWFLAVGALPPGLGWLGLSGVIVLLVSAVLTAGYLLPVVTSAFFPGKDYDEGSIEPMLSRPPANMQLPLTLLSTAALLTGVFAGPLVRYFGRFAATVL